jgi:hypothetical protein
MIANWKDRNMVDFLKENKPHYTVGEILKKISISRGSPKNKYTSKIGKLRIAGPEDLSEEQLQIITDGLKRGVLYCFYFPEDTSPPQNVAQLTVRQRDFFFPTHEIDQKDCLNDMREALKLGLIWHPLVYDYVFSYMALGNKEIIRKIKRGWEKGVKRPIKVKEIILLKYINKYRNNGKTWKEIRRNLMKRKIIGNISVAALKKHYFSKQKQEPNYRNLLRPYRAEAERRLENGENINTILQWLWVELYAKGYQEPYRTLAKSLQKQAVDMTPAVTRPWG